MVGGPVFTIPAGAIVLFLAYPVLERISLAVWRWRRKG
jgi:hypothetical protein